MGAGPAIAIVQIRWTPNLMIGVIVELPNVK